MLMASEKAIAPDPEINQVAWMAGLAIGFNLVGSFMYILRILYSTKI